MELRPISEGEFESITRVLATAFGEDDTEEAREYERPSFEFDRSIAALEDGRMVGSAAAYSFEMTLPGETSVPVAGVTWVGVLPTHRRRGILRSMMGRQLADVRERGEPLAVLTASEGGIYGRFGYGPATFAATVDVPSRDATFRAGPSAGGSLRLIDPEGAAEVLPRVEAACRLARPGTIPRTAASWASYLTDPKDWRDGASARFYVVHEGDGGRADGYATYRVRNTWNRDDPAPGNTVVALDLRAERPEVEAALCRYLLDVDLVNRVSFVKRPLDDPLRWWLADPRRYRVKRAGDWLWVRLVDIPAALAARRYGDEDALVLGVSDPFLPGNAGRYRLEGGPDGATCTRMTDAEGEAAVVLDVDALGAAYLGATSFTTLARGGRVAGRPADLRRADALFHSTPLPFCDLEF